MTFTKFDDMLKRLAEGGIVELKAVTKKAVEEVADARETEHLMTHDGKKVGKRMDDDDDDEDGAATMIGFSGMFDINDVSGALKEVNDAAVKRFLTE